jgi:hypothetical protein
MPVSRTASPATVMPPSARTAAFAAAGFSPHCDPGSGRGYARAKVVPPSSETKAVAGGRERGDPGPRQRLAQAVVDCDELSPHARRVDRLALVEGDHGHERCVVAAGVAVARSDRLIRFPALVAGDRKLRIQCVAGGPDAAMPAIVRTSHAMTTVALWASTQRVTAAEKTSSSVV